MMTVDQDTVYQYQDGWDLLGAALQQRKQLIGNLEHLVRATQESDSHAGDVVGFPVARAQLLLFELSMIGENIDALIREVNSYAERCGRPRVQVVEIKPN